MSGKSPIGSLTGISFTSDRFNVASSAVSFVGYPLVVHYGCFDPVVAKSGSFWIYMVNPAGTNVIFDFNGDTYAVILWPSSIGSYLQTWSNLGTSWTYSFYVWYHIAFTRSSDDAYEYLYVNGTLKSTNTRGTGKIPTYSNTSVCGFGWGNFYLDDFVMFNYYLTPSDVSLIMNLNF